jgi:RimJ/RimL family protein N-acetyltransferase
MRREISRPDLAPKSAPFDAPDAITDGVVTLRAPCADDVEHLARWGTDPVLLDGVWIAARVPHGDIESWAGGVLDDLRAAWTDVGGTQGPALVIDEAEPFVGIVYLMTREPGTVELSYGVAPPFRRRGIASRAASVVSEWLLGDEHCERVELRIADNRPERWVVAERAGFHFVDRFITHVEATGQDCIDRLYVRTRTAG